jgi:microcystin-dependent protein
MSEPYVGEIRIFAGNFAPNGWSFCDGALLPISEFEALFQLIGTTYGGDGQSTFALPDLRGRAIVATGAGPGTSNYVIGQSGGVETVTLTVGQIPAHGTPTATTKTRSRPLFGDGLAPGGSYAPLDAANTHLAPVGGSEPHENMAPFLATSFIISFFGIFPSQN